MGKTKYIDADKLKRHYAWWDDESKKIFDEIIDLQPTADVEEVVRCKDCQYAEPHNDDFWIKNNAPLLCVKYDWYVENDGYCSEGELKNG